MIHVIISGNLYGFSSICSFLSMNSWLSYRNGKNQIHFADNCYIFFSFKSFCSWKAIFCAPMFLC